MKQFNLFPTPIWHTNLQDDSYNELLKNYILAKNLKDSGVKKTNQGGWQSKDLKNEEIFSKLKNKITDLFKNSDLKVKEVIFDQLWCNVNKKHDWNVLHNHGTYQFSIIYYVNCPPDCGYFVIRDPRPGFTGAWGSDFSNAIHGLFRQDTNIKLSPNKGDLLVIPGFLDHCVEPSLSDEPRISIAADCSCLYF